MLRLRTLYFFAFKESGLAASDASHEDLANFAVFHIQNFAGNFGDVATFLQSLLDDGGSLFVADGGNQSGCHSGAVEQGVQAALVVGSDALDAVLAEYAAGVVQHVDGLEQAVEHDGLESVELHLTAFNCHGDGCIVVGNSGEKLVSTLSFTTNPY